MLNPKGFTETDSFKALTQYTIQKLKNLVHSSLKEKKTLNSSFNELLNEIDKTKIQNGEILLSVNGIDINKTKDYLITIKSTELIVDESLKLIEKKTHENNFNLILGRTAVEISGGIAILFKAITFNSYNIYQDSTSFRIGNTQSNKLILPTLFLNFYRKIDEDSFLILPQIGIGTGKDYPSLFLGSGISLPARLLLSVGCSGTLNQKLNKGYEVNQKLKTEDISEFKKRVYTNLPDIRPYISLQMKF